MSNKQLKFGKEIPGKAINKICSRCFIKFCPPSPPPPPSNINDTKTTQNQMIKPQKTKKMQINNHSKTKEKKLYMSRVWSALV